MTNNVEVFETRWYSPEYVDSWLANRTMQASYRPSREKLVSMLPFQPEAIIRVLDIGSGDGALSLIVLEAYPEAQVVCLDFSEIMLAHARQRLAQFSKRVSFVKSNLQDPTWTHGIEETFDAVVSSIAIHDVDEPTPDAPPPPGRIRKIYSEIFGLVKPGGVFFNYDFFLNADFVTPPGSIVREVYLKAQLTAYQALMKVEMGIEKNLPELEQEFQEQRLGRSESSHDRAGRGSPGIRTILNQLEWLKQAGFDEVDCLWKDTRNTIIGGFRH